MNNAIEPEQIPLPIHDLPTSPELDIPTPSDVPSSSSPESHHHARRFILLTAYILSLFISFSAFFIQIKCTFESASIPSFDEFLLRILFPSAGEASSSSVENTAFVRSGHKIPPQFMYEPPLTLTDEELTAAYYLSAEECMLSVPEGCHPLMPRDLSVTADKGLSCSNQTMYDIDLDSFASASIDIDPLSKIRSIYGEDMPVILVLHTHGTEAYAESDDFFYSDSYNSRSHDTSRNVVAVGDAMAAVFERNGIPTLHCREMFDIDSYIKAYSYSESAVREYTEIYPSITYVLDVHRDSVVSDDLTKSRPVTYVNGVRTAQYMCVIGTDEVAGKHTGWRTNLTLACHLQESLNSLSPHMTRRLSVRSASYNQRYAPGSLLLEIGSCGNTLDEALSCGRIVAEQLSKIILENDI